MQGRRYIPPVLNGTPTLLPNPAISPKSFLLHLASKLPHLVPNSTLGSSSISQLCTSQAMACPCCLMLVSSLQMTSEKEPVPSPALPPQGQQ